MTIHYKGYKMRSDRDKYTWTVNIPELERTAVFSGSLTVKQVYKAVQHLIKTES